MPTPAALSLKHFSYTWFHVKSRRDERLDFLHDAVRSLKRCGISAGLDVTIYLICGLIAGVLAGVLAGLKSRDRGFWTLASFLLPPLVLVLLILPKRRGRRGAYGRGSQWDDSNPDKLDNL